MADRDDLRRCLENLEAAVAVLQRSLCDAFLSGLAAQLGAVA